METPLRKQNNIKEIIKSNYKRKFLCLALSPLNQNNIKTRNKSFKHKKDVNYSLSPRILTIQNSFLITQNHKRKEKRYSTTTSITKIKIINQYESKENIIYNKKFVQKGTYNILVAVRVRPLSQKEKLISTDETVNVENKNTIILKDPSEYINPNNIRSKEQYLTFDYAFDKNETQQNIFNSTTKFLINGIVNGFNATVFAYGATGAGKTYTMLGSDDNPGIMSYTLKELFNEIKLYPEREFKVKLWYLEIYNENIRDLLVNNSDNLELREDPIKGLIVNGITEKETNSSEDILSLLKKGNKNRTTEETDANETSSRSHAILQILVSFKNKEKEKDKDNNDINNIYNNVKYGKLSLIDLAGSERASMTGSKGMRLIEGGNINKSLLVLGNCINALCESYVKGNKPHIPYRDSKLTRLLKDSLGGNSRTVMIANVSPFVYNFDDTYNTLKYAERAKHIKTKINANILNYNSQYLRNNYLKVIRNLQRKISDLQKKLLLSEANNKFYKNDDLNSSTPLIRKNSVEIDEKNKKININLLKNNFKNENERNKFKDYNMINTIKEHDIELETSKINSIIEENEKITASLIEDFIEQCQAEVKIKQKIMGIHYDIYLLNNTLKGKEAKNQNISEEKTKLKSYKKILEKNILCLNEISQKNESILLKYSENKNTENDEETKKSNINEENIDELKDDDKIEFNELQKRFMFLVRKICKIQMENIEIKYNYALIKDEIDIKDKKIKDLEKQIEFRDIIIKEKIVLDNDNLTEEELNTKHKLLLSEQRKSKYKTVARLKSNNITQKNNENFNINENIVDNNDKFININGENTFYGNKSNIKNKKKNFSFHPRNSSFVKSNQINTPNRKISKFENSLATNTYLNKDKNYEKENNLNKNNSDFNIDKDINENNDKNTIDTLSKDNDLIGNKFNDIIKNFNIGTITIKNFQNKINNKKNSSEISLNTYQNNKVKNEKSKKNDINKNRNKDKNEDSKDDDFGEETNNKTLKSVLNDIKIVNSNIKSKLNIIENNLKNQSTGQIKPISRTMANAENFKNYINESKDINNDNNKNNKNSVEKNSSLLIKNKKSDIIKKKMTKYTTQTNSTTNSIANLITGHMNHSRDEENIQNNNNINNDSIINDNINKHIIISVNRNKKNKKKNYNLISIGSNTQLNTINNNQDIKNLKTKSPLCKIKSSSNKGIIHSTTKNMNFRKMNKNYSIQRNKSLLSNNIIKDELRKNIKETLNKRINYKIRKKSSKVERRESQTNSISTSFDKFNSKEIKNNNNIINNNLQNKEKTKLQIFYSEHLNKLKNNKNNSPKNLTQKKINPENTIKNSKISINNNNNDYDSSSLVDMGTYQDTIDNRKKKSFISNIKNKDKKDNNKNLNKKIKSNDKNDKKKK